MDIHILRTFTSSPVYFRHSSTRSYLTKSTVNVASCCHTKAEKKKFLTARCIYSKNQIKKYSEM
jgi:hypothetical protein